MSGTDERQRRWREVFFKNLKPDSLLTYSWILKARQVKALALTSDKDVARLIVGDCRTQALHAFWHTHQEIARLFIKSLPQEPTPGASPDKHHRTIEVFGQQ